MKLSKIFKFSLCFSFLFISRVLPENVWGAACCARSAATPVLIVGEDDAQVNFGASLATVVAEPSNSGAPAWVPNDYSEVNRNFRLDGAILLSDRFQIGAGATLVSHQIKTSGESDSTTDLGDTRLSLGYEILPAWTYSRWTPQAFLFSVVSIPTGRSIYQSQAPMATDVTGNGFYSVSFGSLLIKRWSTLDVFLVPEIHYSFSRSFDSFGESYKIVPGVGGSLGVGAGWSPGDGEIRLGLRLQPRYDQTRKLASATLNDKGGWMTSCDVGFDATYLWTSNDSLMFSYTDQTFIGPAKYSNLNRIFAINIQHRWER